MATRLNQILAVLPDRKSHAAGVITKAYQAFKGNTVPLSGITRDYQPRDDDGDRLPSERTYVQTRVPEMLAAVAAALSDLFDVQLTQDVANSKARGSVTLPDGTVLLHEVPVEYLLFLEKQLTDLRTTVNAIPTLDPAERWTWNADAMAYATEPIDTTRTKKIPRNHIKYPHTEQHPAQVEMFYEDQIVGTWRTVKFSGALPGNIKVEIANRLETLRAAVKVGRQEANTIVVEQQRAADKIFTYLFPPTQ